MGLDSRLMLTRAFGNCVHKYQPQMWYAHFADSPGLDLHTFGRVSGQFNLACRSKVSSLRRHKIYIMVSVLDPRWLLIMLASAPMVFLFIVSYVGQTDTLTVSSLSTSLRQTVDKKWSDQFNVSGHRGSEMGCQSQAVAVGEETECSAFRECTPRAWLEFETYGFRSV